MKAVTIFLIIAILSSCNPSPTHKSSQTSSGKTEAEKDGLIYGKWQVVHSTYLPFEHISYCENVNLESIFEFTTDETLEVYETEQSNSCTKDQTFKVLGSTLQIIEWDMVFDYDILMLTRDSLMLKTDRIPSEFWTNAHPNDSILQAKIKAFKETGIQFTLRKMETNRR